MKNTSLRPVTVLSLTLIINILIFCSVLSGIPSVFATTKPEVPNLTSAEKFWLKAHPIIRLAPDPDFQPIEFFDKKGAYSGIGADYATLISKKLGFSFEIVQCKNWDDVLKRMKNREVDVLNAVVRSPQREKYLLFPPPYLKFPSVIIVRKKVKSELNLSMLKGMRVVMVSGYGYVDLIRNKHPEMKIELVADLQTALKKVSFGMADAFVGDLATASFYIESEGITNLKLAGKTEPPNISGFAVRSDWPELSSILEKGIELLTDEERKVIHNKWIHLGDVPGLTLREFRNLALISLSITAFIIVGFLVWNRTLNRVVRIRTKALEKEIEERKQAEEDLKASKKRFKDLAQNSTDWIWEFDENEIFTYASPSIKDLLGYAPEDLIGTSAFEPMSNPEIQKVAKEFNAYKKARKPFSSLININHHKDGTTVVLESSGVPIFDKEGNFRGYRGIDRDITERTNLEDQLRQSHKMEAIGTLAGGIAHDFNNILAIILGYAEMALNDTPNGSHANNQIKEVLKAGNRAKDLVKHILSFSRKESKYMSPVNISQLTKETLQLLRASIPTTIEIKQNIDPLCGNILADQTQIHQVIMNLCTNAAQSMDETGGILEVELVSSHVNMDIVTGSSGRKPEKYVRFTVKDNGIGIEPKDRDRIFDPYFTTKKVGEGTGMGLAVVAGIVKSHDGILSVDSKPGDGAVFNIFFPTIDEQVPATTGETAPLSEGTEKILLVDDEEDLLKMTKKLLERLGYKVTTKTSSLDALDLFFADPGAFDLVITDQTMPELTGERLTEKLLEIRPDIPVVLCTGYSSKINAEKAGTIGIKAFIMKPVSNSQLALTIRQVLDNKN